MRVKRHRDGTFSVSLPAGERELLLGLADQLRDLLVQGDVPGLERLFPPAYANDDQREAEYRALVHGELLEARLAALDVVEATVDADRLNEGELTAWMTAINGVRLVLGTILDVTEEMDDIDADDPRASSFAVYAYLTHLLGQIVQALARW